MSRSVDVAIIGAGSAGLFALSQVRKHTENFVLIDGGELGTTCARVGCMPSKVMIQVAEDFHRRHRYPRVGIEGGKHLALDAPQALEHVQDLRDIFVDRVLATTDELGDELIEGQAKFIEPQVLSVNGERIAARAVIIATGSKPVVPEAWAPFRDRVLTTDDLFELEQLPTSVAVIGLGSIGLEMGQALHRLGVQVAGLDQAQQIGNLGDPVVQQTARDILAKEFPLWTGAAAEITDLGDVLEVRSGEHQIRVERILASLGRAPQLAGLGLEDIGVALDARGVPHFDPHTMQVADFPGLFIAGDCTGDKAILHEAGVEGRIAGFNAVRTNPVAFKRKTPLAITFCDPNIAVVGEPWQQLDSERVIAGEVRFGPVGRALILGKNQGILRVYADKANGRIRGAALIAPHGEHLAHALAWAIQQEMGVVDLLRMPYYHPVIEEALQAALYDALKKIDHTPDTPVELEPLDS